jgi:hypothetical protein
MTDARAGESATQGTDGDDADEPLPAVRDGTDEPAAAVDDHVADLPDGSGCTEIWAHLSAEREDDA